jgi:hypothetical protein
VKLDVWQLTKISNTAKPLILLDNTEFWRAVPSVAMIHARDLVT